MIIKQPILNPSKGYNRNTIIYFSFLTKDPKHGWDINGTYWAVSSWQLLHAEVQRNIETIEYV